MSEQCTDASFQSASPHRSGRIACIGAWCAFMSVASQVLYAKDESERTAPGRGNATQSLMETSGEQAEATEGARTGPMPLEHRDLAVSDSDNGASKDADETKVSDEDVKTAIQLALRDSHLALDDLSVQVDNGVVFLNGSVKSWQAKQRISTLVRSVRGVADVVDAIDVRPQRFSVVPLED